MSRTLMLSTALILAAPSALSAQTVRWNERPTTTWSDEAPRVTVSIEGQRGLVYGSAVRIRFEVSDNAYVTVVRVDDNGRMTILYPYSRNQRATARAGQVNYVRNPRLGNAAFISYDHFGGYVFAMASYAPLDFSSFENRDYDRIGGYSAFTVANRSISRRPDVFIDRFAARVLWDVDTPYDYDVDYYFSSGHPSTTSAYALCNSFARVDDLQYYGSNMWDWDAWEYGGYPYRSMCRGYYNGLRCISSLSYFTLAYFGCDLGSSIIIAGNGPVVGVPGNPVDSADPVPNEGVIRGGLFTPTPVPIPVGGPDGVAPPQERPVGRFDQVRAGGALDGITSIPTRATRKMKEEDTRRERGETDESLTSGTRFDRTDATSKPEKVRTADAGDAPARVQPPAREPTKVKGNSEPRREPTRTSPNFGSTGRTSEPRSTPDRDMGTRSKPASQPANPPSVQGTSTTEKKKPPL